MPHRDFDAICHGFERKKLRMTQKLGTYDTQECFYIYHGMVHTLRHRTIFLRKQVISKGISHPIRKIDHSVKPKVQNKNTSWIFNRLCPEFLWIVSFHILLLCFDAKTEQC
jgi:hypothetical protein